VATSIDTRGNPQPQEMQTPQAVSGAPGGWFTCSVTMTGPAEDGNIYICLAEQSGKFNGWFDAEPSHRKEMLAVALAAMTTTHKVTVYLTSTDYYSQINRLYLLNV